MIARNGETYMINIKNRVTSFRITIIKLFHRDEITKNPAINNNDKAPNPIPNDNRDPEWILD